MVENILVQMAVSDDLFQLIQSLSKNEKGYIKKYAYKAHAKSEVYLGLFQVMDGMASNDEEFILKKMKGKLTKSNLSAAKNYLYQLVLSSLSDYHQKSSVKAEVYGALQSIEVLYERGLYKQAFKISKRTLKLTTKHNLYLEAQIVLRWQDELLHMMGDIKAIAKYVEEGFALEEKAMHEQMNYLTYRKFCVQFFVGVHKGYATEYEPILKQIMAHSMMQDEVLATNVRAQSQMYYVLSKYSRLKNDAQRSYYYRARHVGIIENNTVFKADYPLTYVRALNNLGAIQVELRKYDEVRVVIQKLEAHAKAHPKNKLPVFYTSVQLVLDLALCAEQNTTEEVLTKERQLATLRTRLTPLKAFYVDYMFMLFYVKDRQFKKANRSIQSLLRSELMNDRSDVLKYTRLIQLVVFYERNKFDLLEYALKTTANLLEKSPAQNEQQFNFCKAVRMLILQGAALDRTAFNRLLSNMEIPAPNITCYAFNFRGWLEVQG